MGLGISIKLGGKKPKAPPAPPWEMRDEAIPDTVAGQVVVVINGPPGESTRIARSARLTVIEVSPIEALGKVMLVGSVTAPDTVEAVIARAAKLRGVDWAQPNIQFQPLAAKLPKRFTLIGITRAEQLKVSGTIAMIDTPVDIASPALKGAHFAQSIHGASSAPAAHGTAIASLLVGTGEVAGMAQGARLVSLAAFDPSAKASGISQTRFLAKALDAAWKLRPDVLNLSFGGREDRLLSGLLDALSRKGVCIAAAAGNGGPNSPVLFPARHPAALAVTAVDERMKGYAHAARGAQIGVSGIGVDLLATVPGGFRRVSGTSFATAAVSGALMRMGECTAAHDPAAMRRSVAARALDLGVPGPDPVFGAGLLRLQKK
ncbi:S8 family serine peptidase [Novosphingobium sp. UBA6272]|nr:S8 family serine peptidase [Novosphingobium sp. UBA6272]